MVAQIRPGPTNVVNIDPISTASHVGYAQSCSGLCKSQDILLILPFHPAGPLDKAYSYYVSLKQTQKHKHNHEKSSFVSIAAVK